MSRAVLVHHWEIWGHAPTRKDIAVPWRPGLVVADVIPREEWDRPRLVVRVNGSMIAWEQLGQHELAAGDHVDFGFRPAGAEGVVAALISAGVSAGVSLVLSFLLPKPKGPKRRGDTESPTYSWDGKDNVRIEGQPRQVIYGEIEVAGQVVDQYVRTQTVPARTDLAMLLAFGEGPVEAIGGVTADNPTTTPLSGSNPSFPLPTGIKINGNTLENFRAVEAHVRMGTHEQEPIPEFQEIHTITTVGSTLTQQETSASTNIGTAWALTSFPYNSNDASVQAIWTSYAQAVDIPEEADAYTATITFPEGLYKIDGNGNLQDAYFQALLRYRELDGVGAPITTGGDNGDGWVYAPPIPRLVSRHQGQFSHEVSGLFYGSSGFTPGTQGRILQFDLTGTYARTASSNGGAAVNANTPWTAGQAIEECTFECWYKPASLPDTGTGGANTVRPIMEWYATGPVRGLSLILQRITIDVGSDNSQERWRLRTHWGDGSNTRSFDDALAGGAFQSVANFPTVRWYHIAVTYRRNASGGNERWRAYVDGTLVREFITASSQDMLAPAAPLYLGRTALIGAGTVEGFGRMDEARFWRKELSAAEVVASYNLGVGSFGTNAPELVAGWHFDVQDNLVNFSYAASYATSTNNITTQGTANVGDSTTQLDAVVFRSGSGLLKRARYRVQLLRFNLKSNTTAILDRSDWESIDGRVSEQLAYPNTPLMAIKIPATDQINTTTPTVLSVVKGRKVPVWDRVSLDTPSFAMRWSSSPAWIFVDAVTNPRYGRGGDFTYTNLDLVAITEWADYCDELVYDQLGRREIHSSTSTAEFLNLQYDSTLNDGYGGLDLFMRPGFVPPALWKPGYFLGFEDVVAPPTSGITVDINIGNISGFEISEVFFNGGTWVIRLKYDTATYGDPWADGSLLSTVINPTDVTGSVEGREPRFRFDGVFDTFERTWDRLLEICSAGRAMPILRGSILGVKVSRPRAPVGFVGMGSIKPGTMKVEYRKAKTNVYVADILDRDQGYKRKPVERTDPAIESGALESVIHRENVELVGITRRSQANRDLDFRLNVNRLLTTQGEFVTGVEGMLYEAGDVIVLAHDIVPWGTSGRFAQAQSGATIVLDRDVVITGAETMFVRVRVNAQGQTGSGSTVADYMEVRQITATPDTYLAGDPIDIASAFTVAPAKDDPYLVYRESEQFLVEITETTLTPNFERKVRWVEYNEDVYDVDDPAEDRSDDALEASFSALTSSTTIPGLVDQFDAREGQRLSAQGAYRTDVALSWTLESDTADAVGFVIVWSRAVGDVASPWEEAARVNGKASSAVIRLTNDTPGTELEFAVQPVSTSGARMDVDLCSRARVTVQGVTTKPPQPQRLNAIMDGDQVSYIWTPPPGARGLSYELRRGGWALGQVIGTAPPGANSFGPCRNWAASKPNAAGDPPPIVYIRARDSRGQYSDAAICEGFNPSVLGAQTLVPPNVVGKLIYGDQNWEDYADGWESLTPGPSDPVLVGLETATDDAGRLVLRIAGSNGGGTYVTASAAVPTDTRAEPTYVEAYAVAAQIPPTTMADWTLAFGSPTCASRTMEGVTGAAGCTLVIEWRYKTTPSGDWSEWKTFTPGIYSFVVPQFRITIGRPNTGWQVHVRRFGTRMSRVPKIRFEQSDVARFALKGAAF